MLIFFSGSKKKTAYPLLLVVKDTMIILPSTIVTHSKVSTRFSFLLRFSLLAGYETRCGQVKFTVFLT
jgi:hypothetical protein